MTLRFQVRCQSTMEVDLSPICFHDLRAKSLDDVRRTEIRPDLGTLGDWFAIDGSADDLQWIIEGAGSWLHGVGTGLREGTVIVDGDLGHFVGRKACGGTIIVRGSVGHFAGTGMRSGRIHVAGSAGDVLGGPLRGERTGMRGGLMTVAGNCGQRAAYRMRRGIILVAGNTGPLAAWEMIAGTLVAGRCAEDLGFGMRRGTVVLTDEGQNNCGEEVMLEPIEQGRFSRWLQPSLDFFPLLFDEISRGWYLHRELHSESSSSEISRLCELGGNWRSRNWLRSQGDRSVGGLGELLCPL